VLNQFAAPQLQTLSDEPTFSLQADILIANILANPLMELAPRFAKLVKPGGKIVLSGILTRQAEEIIEAYAPYCQLRVGAELEGWVRLEGETLSRRL
jgi:ribosomal protein L11 methyltransferase